MHFFKTRLIDLVAILFGISVITFLMIRLIPGDAVAIMLGANTEVTQDRIDALRAQLGLDKSFVVQYVDWLGGVLSGDLGQSIWTKQPVLDEILAHIWPTLQLTFFSLFLGAGLALPLGIMMAQLRGKKWDMILQVSSVVGLTVPSFWLGIMMILLVSILAPHWQVLGYVAFSEDPIGNLQRLFLPSVALALPIMANLARLTRSAMLETLQQDFIRTAKAKGVSPTGVLYRHALRSTLIPFVTSAGIMTGYLLSGAIVVEQVFAIPGLGRLVLGAIAERNYPLVQGTVLVITFAFVFINFLVDMVYAWIDPRVGQ